MVQDNKIPKVLVVSLKDKNNQRLSCKRRNCPGTTFIHLGTKFKCLKCGSIHQIADLNFTAWEICAYAESQTEP